MDDDIESYIDNIVGEAKAVYIEKDSFIIVDRGVKGFVMFYPSHDPEQTEVVEVPFDIVARVEIILQEDLGKYVDRNGILTILCGQYFQSWDVSRKKKGKRIYYGYSKSHYIFLIGRIVQCLEEHGLLSAVLRTFTGRVDPETGLPIKKLRGFLVLYNQSGGIDVKEVSIDDLVDAFTTDPVTGEKIPHEPAVEYCYRETCVSPKELDNLHTG